MWSLLPAPRGLVSSETQQSELSPSRASRHSPQGEHQGSAGGPGGGGGRHGSWPRICSTAGTGPVASVAQARPGWDPAPCSDCVGVRRGGERGQWDPSPTEAALQLGGAPPPPPPWPWKLQRCGPVPLASGHRRALRVPCPWGERPLPRAAPSPHLPQHSPVRQPPGTSDVCLDLPHPRPTPQTCLGSRLGPAPLSRWWTLSAPCQPPARVCSPPPS